MRVLSWWWAIPAILVVSAAPATAWSQALTAEVRPKASVEDHDPIFEATGVGDPAAIYSSVGQPLIGWSIGTVADTRIAAGIWHIMGTGPVVSAPRPQPHTGFALGQNVPNPFGRTTQISFAVPQRDRVSLRVFDVLGRSVATLIDQNLEAGEYEAMVTAHTLSPGIYLYRLQSSRETLTRKLLLLDDGGVK